MHLVKSASGNLLSGENGELDLHLLSWINLKHTKLK